MLREPIIMFSFWGRRENIELQRPFIKRILDQYPTAQFHAINLARCRDDLFYLKSPMRDPHVTVHHEFYHTRPAGEGYNRVYRYFAQPQFKDCLFVKFDDDVAFLQTQRFDELVSAIKANPGTIVSADTINNGACARHQAGIWERFDATGASLLDWHLRQDTAPMAHQHFFEHWRALLTQPPKLIPTDDWLSINAIGFDWSACRAIAERVDTPSPRWIAGREFQRHDRLGDEGAANTLPRTILQGFMATHLGFGPQNPTRGQLASWRENYAEIGRLYLSEGTEKGRPLAVEVTKTAR